MSGDVIRNEVGAVKALKAGVERYAEMIKGATEQARRELMGAERESQNVVEQRRSTLQRAERELQRVKTELARADKEERARLEQQVHAVSQWQAEARQQMERARRAAQQVASARSELMTVLQASDSAVGEHSSAAASALATLDAKLRALGDHGFMSSPAGMIGKAVATEVALQAVAEAGTRALGHLTGVGDIPDPFVSQKVDEIVHAVKDEVSDLVDRARGSE